MHLLLYDKPFEHKHMVLQWLYIKLILQYIQEYNCGGLTKIKQIFDSI